MSAQWFRCACPRGCLFVVRQAGAWCPSCASDCTAGSRVARWLEYRAAAVLEHRARRRQRDRLVVDPDAQSCLFTKARSIALSAVEPGEPYFGPVDAA